MVRTILVATALVAGLILTVDTSATASIIGLAPGYCTSDCGIGDPMILHFDENGNGTIAMNGGPTTSLTGVLATDPSNPNSGGVPVLTYFLPLPVASGDVSFAEPGGGISDWLRFTDNTGVISGGVTGAGSRMIFYSDLELGVFNGDLADTGFPGNIGTGNTVAQLEVGPEGNNGFDYQPGGVPYPANNEYVGISDISVPEPASLALLGSAIMATELAILRRRRQGKASEVLTRFT